MGSAILDQLDTFGPERCERLDYAQAVEYTRRLARTHYENFTVVSWLLPRLLRDDFRNVYAFCRWADDLGDETGDPARSLDLLAWWRRELDDCYAGRPRHPVFVALERTIRQHDIPRTPFDDLIDAFIQDQTVLRYRTWDQTLDYCKRSADPVGRLVLYVCGYRDHRRQQLSDATCTALQLANFWQDVRRDAADRNRVYIPEDVARRHSLDIDLMAKAIQADERASPRGQSACACASVPSAGISAVLPGFRAALKELVDRTWPLFEQGRPLGALVAPDVRVDIDLFSLGGESILKMIRRRDYDTLTLRPSLGKGAKLALMFRALAGKLRSGLSSNPGAEAGGGLEHG